MTILKGSATVEMIRTELCAIFREKEINWDIYKQATENEFMIVFPDDDRRQQLSRVKNFEFETAPLKVQVRDTELNPGSDGCLEVVWVRAYNFPDFALSPEVVMEVSHLAGDPEEVDMASLKWNGPVRVKIGCRDSRELKGETQVFSMEIAEELDGWWRVAKTNLRKKPTSLNLIDTGGGLMMGMKMMQVIRIGLREDNSREIRMVTDTLILVKVLLSHKRVWFTKPWLRLAKQS